MSIKELEAKAQENKARPTLEKGTVHDTGNTHRNGAIFALMEIQNEDYLRRIYHLTARLHRREHSIQATEAQT